MSYSAGIMWCPRCFTNRRFYVEVMARPGVFPDAYCDVCDYEFAEGVVSDAKRLQALEDLRRDQIKHASVEDTFDFRGRRRRR